MIEFLLISLIFFYIGRSTATNEDIVQVKKVMEKVKKQSIGAVKRPTAKQLREKNTVDGQAKKEVKKLWDNVFKRK